MVVFGVKRKCKMYLTKVVVVFLFLSVAVMASTDSKDVKSDSLKQEEQFSVDYRTAMRLYLNDQYLEASAAFDKLIKNTPDHRLMDQAAFYRAKAYENHQMYKEAKAAYGDAIKLYPNSNQQDKYHLGLLNIAYSENRYEDALAEYKFFVQHFKGSDSRCEADYIAGLTKFKQGNYKEAVGLLASINSGNSYYFNARYTSGLAYDRMGQKEKAEKCFRSILDEPAANESEFALQDSAMCKLNLKK